MSIADTLLIPALILPLIPAFLLGKDGNGWYYLGTFILFYMCFGFMEFLSTKFRKKSISKDISQSKPVIFWSIVASWFVFAIGLSLHWYLMR